MTCATSYISSVDDTQRVKPGTFITGYVYNMCRERGRRDRERKRGRAREREIEVYIYTKYSTQKHMQLKRAARGSSTPRALAYKTLKSRQSVQGF